MSETTTEEQRCPVLNIDMEVSFQALTLDLLDSYEKLEPFGNSKMCIRDSSTAGRIPFLHAARAFLAAREGGRRGIWKGLPDGGRI